MANAKHGYLGAKKVPEEEFKGTFLRKYVRLCDG